MKSKTPKTDWLYDHTRMTAEQYNAMSELELQLNAALETIATQREHIAELKSQTAAAMPNTEVSHGGGTER